MKAVKTLKDYALSTRQPQVEEARQSSEDMDMTAGSHRTCGIFPVRYINQFLCDLYTFRQALMGNFVSNTPENDAGMIPVPHDQSPELIHYFG